MSLLNKISLWFIGIILLITPVTMYISYNNIRKRLDHAETERLSFVNEHVIGQLQRGEQPETATQGMPITVTPFTGTLPAAPEVIHTCGTAEGLQKNECIIRVNSYAAVNGQTFKISSYNYVTKTDYILQGMLNAVLWKMLLIVAAVAITARILSRYILKPFRKAMSAMRNFELQQKERLQLSNTSTKEFRELNDFLQNMTDKALEDYLAVKEFSENASHELQTPLAVIQSKIELLTETNIDLQQAELITDMQNAIEKLSRINRSLTLLTKLDNHEFPADEPLRFCTITKSALDDFADRISLKNISIRNKVDHDVVVKIHPSLAEILVNNLLTNAIRHNIEGGAIEIALTQRYLQISNTGKAPEIPTEELFQRFRKSNQSADSIGLGLAIVKQICEVSEFCVDYDFRDGWHNLTVYFCRKAELRPVQPRIIKDAAVEVVTEG